MFPAAAHGERRHPHDSQQCRDFSRLADRHRPQRDFPDGQQLGITPDKFWEVNDGIVVEDVRKAFNIFQIPNVGAQLMDIINYAFKLAEEATNIPLISQGKTDDNTPETFGAAEIHNDNANALLRHQGYSVDDHVTEPVVHQSYEYLLMDPDVPDEEKATSTSTPRARSTWWKKRFRRSSLMSHRQRGAQPAFGLNPEKWIEEVYRASAWTHASSCTPRKRRQRKRSSRHRKIRASRRRTFRPRRESTPPR